MFALSALSATAFLLQRASPTSVQHVAAAPSASLVMTHDVRGTDRRTALGLVAGAAAAGAPPNEYLPRLLWYAYTW